MSQIILHDIKSVLPILDGKKIMLVKGGSFDNLGLKDFFAKFKMVEFSDFTPNPLYEQVCKGVEIFNKEKCEIIVAVGGGSVIDVAKCIKLYSKMDSSLNYLGQEMKDTGVPLVAVPTTAGTGSESTRHAVIYYNGEKQSVSHQSIVPDYAVLEPSVLNTLPVYQKKCTMLDALCQAIESWWSVNSTDESIGLSRKAVTGIRDNWKAYIYDNSKEAAGKILEAANYSGQAINITATTAAHAMSYKITSLYKLPHGHAVAVCMPEVWNYIINNIDRCADARGKKHLEKTMADISQLVEPSWFDSLLKELDIVNPVSDNRAEDIEILAGSVNPVRLKNNPVELTYGVMKDMYERIVK